MDRSTGKQLTTKSRGNVIPITLVGEVDSAGRLLQSSIEGTVDVSLPLCLATIGMTQDEQDEAYADFLNRRPVTYLITKPDGVTESGRVVYIDQAQPVDFDELDPVDLEEYHDIDTDYYWGVLGRDHMMQYEMQYGNFPDFPFTMYPQVVCETCPNGDTETFFMWCAEQAFFGTDNCCLVGQAQMQDPNPDQDMRRLGKCSQ